MSCITNFGYISAAVGQAAAITAKAAADVAIQVGVALWQRNASQSISNMQTQLADRQVRLAEAVHAHAIQFWPAEANLVTDVFSEGRAVAQYAALGQAWGGITIDTMADAHQVWLDDARQNCRSPSRCDDARWQRNAVAAQVDLSSYGYRQAEAREQITNDRRFARQITVLGMSRGQLNNLISYQSVSQASGLSASGMLEGTVNSALQAYGYYTTRAGAPEPWGAPIRDSLSQARMPAPVMVSQPAGADTFGLAESGRAPVEQLPPVKRRGKAGEFDDVDWRGL